MNCSEMIIDNSSNESDSMLTEDFHSPTSELIGLCSYASLGSAMIACNLFLLIAFSRKKTLAFFYAKGITIGNMLTGTGYLCSAIYRLVVYLHYFDPLSPLECMCRNWQLSFFIVGDSLCLTSFLLLGNQQYSAITGRSMGKRINTIVVHMTIPVFICLMLITCWLSAIFNPIQKISAYCYSPNVISIQAVQIFWGTMAFMGLLNCFIYVITLFQLHNRRKRDFFKIGSITFDRDLTVAKRLCVYMIALFMISVFPDLIICFCLKCLPFQYLFIVPGITRTAGILLIYFTRPQFRALWSAHGGGKEKDNLGVQHALEKVKENNKI